MSPKPHEPKLGPQERAVLRHIARANTTTAGLAGLDYPGGIAHPRVVSIFTRLVREGYVNRVNDRYYVTPAGVARANSMDSH